VDVISGKLLLSAATKLGDDLRRKATFRLRVSRRVRRLSRVNFPRRQYNKWLRTLDAERLGAPAEEAGPSLALSLQSYLAADVRWKVRDNQAADALRLVEATYLALLAANSAEDARILQEQWERHRNESLAVPLRQLAQAQGGARLPADNLAEHLLRRSAERQHQRLATLGFDAASPILGVAPLAATEVPVAAVRVLTGPYGAGKSEVAETWHRAQIAAFRTLDLAPVPAWLSARAIGEDFDGAVLTAIGGADLALERGAAVVLDGLDEVDTSRAANLLEQTRIFVAGAPRSSVLVTSRPGIVTIGIAEQVPVRELQWEQAAVLIQTAANLPQPPGWDWPEPMKKTVQRPFFALAAAKALASGHRLGGRAGLMRFVVDEALSRAGAAPVAASPDLFALHVQLGKEAVSAGGTVDPRRFSPPQQLHLLATRLVVLRDGLLAFSLPLFEQWFAAQALLSGDQPVTEVTKSTHIFDLWRWAIAMAASEGTAEQVDELMGQLVQWNPGAAAWVLSQSSGGTWFDGTATQRSLEADEAQERLCNATITWASALGPLGPHLFPFRSDGRLQTLAVSAGDRQVVRGWWQGADRDEQVVLLPSEAHPLSPPVPDWWTYFSGTVAPEDIWPWLLLRDDVKRELSSLLRGTSYLHLLPEAGIVAREINYERARILAGAARNVLHKPIPKQALRQTAIGLLRATESDADAMFQLNGRMISSVEIGALVAWLNASSGEEVRRPLPAPDLDDPRGAHIWSFYSDDRLLETVVETFAAACEAYEELTTALFPRFGWAFGLGSVGKIGVVGSMDPGGRDQREYPGVQYQVLPLELAIDEAAGRLRSKNERAFFNKGPAQSFLENGWMVRSEAFREWARGRNIPPFWRLTTTTSVLKVTGDRPATAQAVDWMWRDLAVLGLASGGAPDIG
jgi:hypothetical protein